MTSTPAGINVPTGGGGSSSTGPGAGTFATHADVVNVSNEGLQRIALEKQKILQKLQEQYVHLVQTNQGYQELTDRITMLEKLVHHAGEGTQLLKSAALWGLSHTLRDAFTEVRNREEREALQAKGDMGTLDQGRRSRRRKSLATSHFFVDHMPCREQRNTCLCFFFFYLINSKSFSARKPKCCLGKNHKGELSLANYEVPTRYVMDPQDTTKFTLRLDKTDDMVLPKARGNDTLSAQSHQQPNRAFHAQGPSFASQYQYHEGQYVSRDQFSRIFAEQQQNRSGLIDGGGLAETLAMP
ncbi:unnamed protein product [Amoebophrya sp. A120]|nr:unnamed protein product [Amoebophrya sp. A120]|eukprot:GSA120T00005400001.1